MNQISFLFPRRSLFTPSVTLSACHLPLRGRQLKAPFREGGGSRRLSGGVSAMSIKAETNIENIGLNLDNRIKIFGHVIAQYSMRRGVAPSPFPTAGTTFPLDTFLLTLRFFPFPAASSILWLHCTSPANLLSCPGQFVAGFT